MTGNSWGNTRKTFGFSRFSALIGLRVSCSAQAKGLIAYNFHSLKRDMFRIRFAISLTGGDENKDMRKGTDVSTSKCKNQRK